MKRLDQLSKNVLQNALRFTGRLRVVEAPRSNPSKFDSEEGVKEHQPGVTVAYALDQYGKVRKLKFCAYDVCIYIYRSCNVSMIYAIHEVSHCIAWPISTLNMQRMV